MAPIKGVSGNTVGVVAKTDAQLLTRVPREEPVIAPICNKLFQRIVIRLLPIGIGLFAMMTRQILKSMDIVSEEMLEREAQQFLVLMAYICVMIMPEQVIEHYIMSPSNQQMAMLNKLEKYLNLKQSKDPTLYLDTDVNGVMMSLKQGHCSGLTIHWMELVMLKRANEYHQVVSEIVTWDGSEEKLTPELDDKINDFFQQISFKQQRYFAKETMGAPISQMQQQDIVESIGRGDKYHQVREFNVLSADLEVVFKKHLTDQNVIYGQSEKSEDGKGTHALGLAMRDGKFLLFDSNYSGKERNYNPAMSACVFQTMAAFISEFEARLPPQGDNPTFGFVVLEHGIEA